MHRTMHRTMQRTACAVFALALISLATPCFAAASLTHDTAPLSAGQDSVPLLYSLIMGFGIVASARGKSAKELREERAKVGTEIEKFREGIDAEAYEWKAEDDATLERMSADYDEYTRYISAAELAERVKDDRDNPGRPDLRDDRDQPGDDPDKRADGKGKQRGGKADETELQHGDVERALQGWFLRNSGGELTDAHKRAIQRSKLHNQVRTVGRRGDLEIRLSDGYEFTRRARSMAFDKPHTRAGLDVATSGAGKETIPMGFVNSLEVNMLAHSPMLQVSEIIRTATGNDLPWPQVDDTGNEAVILGEATTIGASVDPTFASQTWKAYKLSSKPVLMSFELEQDSAFSMASVIGSLLGERLGRGQSTYFTTGTGSAQPGGIVTESTLGVTAAGAAAITADELIDLEHSVDPAYREMNPAYMMHDNVLKYLRKLKTSDGAYIFDYQRGAPNTIANRDYQVNNKMSSAITTGLKTVLFGDLSKYKVRHVSTVRLRRLDERYADTDQVAFIAFLRVDGHLLDTGTAPVKYLQQA